MRVMIMTADRDTDENATPALPASMDEAIATLAGDTSDGWSTTSEQPPRRRRKQMTATAPSSAGAAAPDPWGPVTPDDDPVESARRKGPATLCALVMLRAALLDAPGFLDRAMVPGVVSIIHAPDKEWGMSIGRAWLSVVGVIYDRMYPPTDPIGTAGSSVRTPAAKMPSWARGHPNGPSHFSIFERPPPRSASIEIVRESLDDGRPIHVVTHHPAILDPDILLVEEQRLVIPPMDGQHIAQCADAIQPSGPWPPLGRIGIPPLLAEAAPELLPFHLNAAWRADQDAAAYIGRLAELVTRRTTLAAADNVRSMPTLENLPGLGEAGEWGRRAVVDLKAYARGELPWSELDRGVVLEGPPGTGKSTFARALAGSAGLPLVASSLAQWQGHKEGHLGNLLSAMQATFAHARKLAPCIMLVDEIDSFPTRSAITHRHRDYVVEVINALLEQLDGAVDRQGVVVIGTCNDATGLDPAILRPGRLERVIRLSRPDASGVEAILRIHLGDALKDEDLKPLAATAVVRQAVGADVEAWCRGARRRARAQGRPMILADLEAEIGPAPPVHSPAALLRMAMHEAGHALAFAVMAPGVLKEVVVDTAVGGRSMTAVDTSEILREAPHATHRQSMDQLRAILSGRAAEEVILGEPSGGAGGSRGSDLARATRLASAVMASSGLDGHSDRLVFLGAADDPERLDQILLMPDIRCRASAILRQAYDEALELIRQHQGIVERIAELLVRDGRISGEEVEALLQGRPRPDAAAGTPS
ncbi:AAA family ATPase [Pararoseomonas sp. SCSIO 73927]|uniref:AAA family ATPase n=1 Tax=Pararoseomonas sp. SCSIO 73927 TaxID=3114537 RepID=UPI0030D1A630